MALEFDTDKHLMHIEIVLGKDGNMSTEVRRTEEVDHGMVEHLAAGIFERAKLELLQHAYRSNRTEHREELEQADDQPPGPNTLQAAAAADISKVDFRSLVRMVMPEYDDAQCDDLFEEFKSGASPFDAAKRAVEKRRA